VRLTAQAAPPRDALAAQATAALDRRLAASGSRPLAVAFSGGGDSLALLLLVQAWAAARGRRVLALHVDHRLQPQSADWSRACAATAARLAVAFHALAWRGPKPVSGLSAAAREARHALLAQAAREAGAQVLLMGHTADDLAEARLMRELGARVGEPRQWAPSPAWPAGRGVFVLRPLLGVGRVDIRRWLAARGEGWIDDPANDDARYARSRARRALAGGGSAPEAPPPGPDLASALAQAVRASRFGELTIARAALRQADAAAVQAFVAAACICASGQATPPRGERAARQALALLGEAAVRATLAGARVVADAHEALFCREPGEAARGGLAPMILLPGRAVVWDGRFEIVAAARGLVVRPLAGVAAKLPHAERRDLLRLRSDLRGALPVLQDAAGALSCPLLAAPGGAAVRSLSQARLEAALGLVQREQAD